MPGKGVKQLQTKRGQLVTLADLNPGGHPAERRRWMLSSLHTRFPAPREGHQVTKVPFRQAAVPEPYTEPHINQPSVHPEDVPERSAVCCDGGEHAQLFCISWAGTRESQEQDTVPLSTL